MNRIFITFLFACLTLVAQVNTGSISGYVLDPSGKMVPGATVKLEDTARSATRTAESNPSGYYEFSGLPTAEYRVSAAAPSLVQSPIVVQVEVDQRLRLDLVGAQRAPVRGEYLDVKVPSRRDCLANREVEPGEQTARHARGQLAGDVHGTSQEIEPPFATLGCSADQRRLVLAARVEQEAGTRLDHAGHVLLCERCSRPQL